MVTQTAPKAVSDVARELATLLVRVPLESPGAQEKIEELVATAHAGAAYGTGLAAAKDALGQTLGVLLNNLPRHERDALQTQFESQFTQEFRRLAPRIKIH
ncbi:MAG: hypothetical protein A3J68_01050 [Candidatus Wildermuthbacteria bacterium RIFCSPHIGHO2_02_FULL_48_16]|uniref:Uncharacterized protein n=2 Tax=Candidatus Wildermuthiibacteriota TaxID=1817923 RepID=A0A1G2R7X3_9BACT|nr:MAG: hypothetical protein A2842_00135 [Candidatus Wildermuthbacteria bacterium RIFCSPHIGHO2_01_FULL_48_25]OHA68940.1 MAG: hypothetical protein A3J68_01050 [Candidatus Wildermuthbacteria bacterium RIFCSPHIGHO2_02_FULL_48_16]OHA73744.1 MAG: hypothetical protein A3B24_02985 [Candidatus Wildermuthbacteria bacterium RIFCSPLOWO2_01_FULL_48_16]